MRWPFLALILLLLGCASAIQQIAATYQTPERLEFFLQNRKPKYQSDFGPKPTSYSHTICVFKDRDGYSYFSQATLVRLNALTLEAVLDDVNSNWIWAAVAVRVGRQAQAKDGKHILNPKKIEGRDYVLKEGVASNRTLDDWKSPEEFLKDGGGDCEDYAVFVQEILERNGYQAEIVSLYAPKSVDRKQ